ncbi:hypothetical protein HK107_05070 [Parvularcula sp. ZS-1/3]|uniref:PDZ domain-containing protein n=1 Tax=Parvularcula mediterranea TaxID=2732508 RepID=A0A7Y3RKF2_9PROT|nr:aspartyl protease family protein [Parvularcula mediterranea]NNU15688.1 hypothetical protein [Parvularcula mediterranea]
MNLFRCCAFVFAAFSLTKPACAQEIGVQTALTAKPVIERHVEVSSVPVDERGGKLYLRAQVVGIEREFIFDTGSPSMISKELASELGLETIAESTGIDANGQAVTAEIAVLESVQLGDATFRDVPVLIFDFATMPMGACVFDGGVLGSELLPGSAWRIDLDRGALDIAASAEAFGKSRKVHSAPLTLSGFPHMPLIDYSVNGFSDKALFDTGNAGSLILFKEIANDREVRKAIKRGSDQRGRGSEGVSAGGMGPEVELRRFSLKDLKIGKHTIGKVTASTRQVPPTLLGAGFLSENIVTLDYPGATFSWSPRETPAPSKAHQGFGVSFVDTKPLVVQLFEGSVAAKRGLRLGDEVHSLDGRSLAAETDDERCQHLRWLINRPTDRTFSSVTVLRDGQPELIELE